jgi:hypothetical protein
MGVVEQEDRNECNACLRENTANVKRWRKRKVTLMPAPRHCSICGDNDHNRTGHEAAVAVAAAVRRTA